MRLFCLSVIVAISGCATEVNRLQTIAQPLRADSSFYVLQCADGQHDGHRQISSGLITSRRVTAELKVHAHRVEESDREENLQSGLISARNRNLSYIVSPSILDWQNDATPMASVPDKIKVRIDIVDVASANVIDSVVLQKQTATAATSKVPPQELLDAPLKGYVEMLIQSEPSEAKQSFWKKVQSWF